MFRVTSITLQPYEAAMFPELDLSLDYNVNCYDHSCTLYLVYICFFLAAVVRFTDNCIENLCLGEVYYLGKF